MTIKYECHNQLSGLNEQANSFDQAVLLRQRLRDEYIVANVDPLFVITALVENEDGTITQTAVDMNGEPIDPLLSYYSQSISTGAA